MEREALHNVLPVKFCDLTLWLGFAAAYAVVVFAVVMLFVTEPKKEPEDNGKKNLTGGSRDSREGTE